MANYRVCTKDYWGRPWTYWDDGSESQLHAAPGCSEPGTHMHTHVHCYQLTVVFLLVDFVLCFTKCLQFIGTTVPNLS